MGALFALLFKVNKVPVTVVELAKKRRNLINSWGIECYESGEVGDGKFDNIVIAVNKAEVIGEYVKKVADSGTILVFGGLKRDEMLYIDSYSVHYREVTVAGSFGYAIRHFKEALEMIKIYPETFSKVITP